MTPSVIRSAEGDGTGGLVVYLLPTLVTACLAVCITAATYWSARPFQNLITALCLTVREHCRRGPNAHWALERHEMASGAEPQRQRSEYLRAELPDLSHRHIRLNRSL